MVQVGKLDGIRVVHVGRRRDSDRLALPIRSRGVAIPGSSTLSLKRELEAVQSVISGRQADRVGGSVREALVIVAVTIMVQSRVVFGEGPVLNAIRRVPDKSHLGIGMQVGIVTGHPELDRSILVHPESR